jgi:hypothetical protein
VKVVAWGSTALSDMLLTSMLGGSLLSFFWGYVGRKLIPSKHEWGYSVSAIFMGLACLAKGPIGIAFPVSIPHYVVLAIDVKLGTYYWQNLATSFPVSKMRIFKKKIFEAVHLLLSLTHVQFVVLPAQMRNVFLTLHYC